jgi:hypothetical protein
LNAQNIGNSTATWVSQPYPYDLQGDETTWTAQAQTAVQCATVTNFAESFQNSDASGTLYFNYTWSSRSGNNKDLIACTTGESIFYPSQTNPY